jgi:hypothetical protein
MTDDFAAYDVWESCERCKALHPQMCAEHVRDDARRRALPAALALNLRDRVAQLRTTRLTLIPTAAGLIVERNDDGSELGRELQRLALRIGTDAAWALLAQLDALAAWIDLD